MGRIDNLAVVNPNFSLVLPVGCNAHCKFCFWSKHDDALTEEAYIRRVKYAIRELPEAFNQCSITGGEPSLFKRLPELCELVKTRFDKVVLTTNGRVPSATYNVNHVNISRHSYEDDRNFEVFNTFTVANTGKLRRLCLQYEGKGTDVTLNCVVPAHASLAELRKFIAYAQQVGAHSVCFRVKMGTLRRLKCLDNVHVKTISECPVCRREQILLQGMIVTVAYSLAEPSNELGGVYELILQPDGYITSDWEGKHRVALRPRKMKLGGEAVRGGGGCGGRGCYPPMRACGLGGC